MRTLGENEIVRLTSDVDETLARFSSTVGGMLTAFPALLGQFKGILCAL